MLFFSSAIFFPYSSFSRPFDVETDRFYDSAKNIIFIDKIEDKILSGTLINKNSVSRDTAESYSGNYSVSENLVLKLKETDDKYVLEKPDIYRKFFNFFIKISSFIAESIGKNGKTEWKIALIKTVSIILTITTISLFFSTGKWPLINYLFSQFLVICFIWFNFYIQKISLPFFLQGAENLVPFRNGIYYFAYIVISLSVLLVKLLSLRGDK